MARYIAALRAKAGEATALQHLIPAARARVLPMVALSATPTPNFAPSLITAWAGLPLALDGQYNDHISGSAAAFTAMFHAAGNGGIPIIPTASMRSSTSYLNAVRNAVGRYAPGLVVRCRLNELSSIGAWATARDWHLADADLLITLGDVSTQDPGTFASYLIHTLTTQLPRRPQWRSITLGASSAPRDHGALNPGQNIVPRREWQIWQAVAPNVPFSLDYADSGPLYPSLDEPPGFALATATVSVRYTTEPHWIILKGTRTTGPRGRSMTLQYRAHARALVRDRLFGRVTGCWADDQIQAIATETRTAGNRTTWAAIGVNRHLSVIADRLP
jgi:hypothetical protein